MVNTSLVETIKALNEEEISDLHLYLDSLLHNRGPHRQEIAKLFDFIAAAYPDFKADHLIRVQAYHLLYGEELPVKGKLDKVMTALLQHIRSFVLSRNYLAETNQFEQWVKWAAWLRSRGAEDLYQKAMGKLDKWKLGDDALDEAIYYGQFVFDREKHDYLSFTNHKKGDVNLPKVIRNLDFFYHLNRLEFLNRLLLQTKVTSLKLEPEVEPKLAKFNVPTKYLKENPILYAEYCLFNLLKYKVPPIEKVLEFRKWFSEHEQEMGPEFRYRFWAYLRGLYTILINEGNKDMALGLHHIHLDNLSKGYLFYHGKLSPSAYINVTFIALSVGQTNWALEFVETHKDLVIGENETKDFYRFNLARCFFTLGEFEKSLESLPLASTYNDYHSAARRLELQIYFELNSDLFPYKMDAFKMYAYRGSKNLFSEKKGELLLNFYKMLQQIYQIPKGDKARAQQILERIEKKKSVADKGWLILKVKQLI